MWNNDIKCKYMFLFPLKNLARKGLTMFSGIYLWAISQWVVELLFCIILKLLPHLPGPNELTFLVSTKGFHSSGASLSKEHTCSMFEKWLHFLHFPFSLFRFQVADVQPSRMHLLWWLPCACVIVIDHIRCRNTVFQSVFWFKVFAKSSNWPKVSIGSGNVYFLWPSDTTIWHYRSWFR